MGDKIKLPMDYAREKLSTLRARWNGRMGDLVRRHGPRLWPELTRHPALVGWSASSMGSHETGGPPDFATGIYGVEADKLRALCRDAEVVLGRSVSPEVRSGGYLDDLEGQVVTGLLNYRRHLELLQARTPSALWGERTHPSFIVRATVAAYSSGPGITGAALSEYADELVAAPPSAWWSTLGRCVATETRDKIGKYPIEGKWKVAFLVLRAEQRAMSGMLVDAELGPDEAREPWYAPWTTEAENRATVATLKERADA